MLQGGRDHRCQTDVFHTQSRAYDQAQLIVQLFYAGNLFWAALRLMERERWSAYDTLQPLWPMFWADGVDVELAAAVVLTTNAIVAAVATFWPTNGFARWLAFGGALMAGAFENSFGRIGHGGHAWVWTTFFFAFLPSGSSHRFVDSRVRRQRFLQILWTTQFALLFFYSMSGWLKLVTVPIQLLRGEVHAIAPEALSRHIANRIMQTNSHPLFGELLIDHSICSWFLYMGALYLEAFAVLVAFRPALHRLWGGGLILLHLGIGFGMEIWFVPPMFLLALLFVNSPFQRREETWRNTLLQLPGMELMRYRAQIAEAPVPWHAAIAEGPRLPKRQKLHRTSRQASPMQ
jgi:hypothetical protein